MTAKPACNLPGTKAHFYQAAQAAALFKTEMIVFDSNDDPGHSRCRTWFGNLAYREIAQELARRGHLNSNGRAFSASSVRSMLVGV